MAAYYSEFMTTHSNLGADAILKKHPAREIVLALDRYQTALHILSGNTFELLRFTSEIESGRFAEIALNPERRGEYRDFENHLIRYFHNYLAGARTLVDHTRVLMKLSFISPDHHTAYNQKISEMFSDSVSYFIQDFRNYALHCGLPQMIHTFHVTEARWEVALSLNEIRKWNGWKSKAKPFFESNPDTIHLSVLVKMYEELSMAFHVWLVRSFKTYYGSVFDDYDELLKSMTENTDCEPPSR